MLYVKYNPRIPDPNLDAMIDWYFDHLSRSCATQMMFEALGITAGKIRVKPESYERVVRLSKVRLVEILGAERQ